MFVSIMVTAQDEGSLSGEFNGYVFDQFIEQAENQTNYHFYYNQSDLDSLHIQLNIDNEPLELVLEKIFSGTPYHYAIDQRNNVFITKGKEIRTALPVGFFDPSRNNNDY